MAKTIINHKLAKNPIRIIRWKDGTIESYLEDNKKLTVEEYVKQKEQEGKICVVIL